MSGDFGHFEGEVVARWLRDPGRPDRDMELVQDFAYVDTAGKSWLAPAGSRVNGASIPAVLWSAPAGTPYVGDYRRATVIHDVYCDLGSEPAHAVHRMFYDAMRCDGVTLLRATSMYLAVSIFGQGCGRERLAPAPPMTAEQLEALQQAVEEAFEEHGMDADVEVIEEAVRESLGRP